MSFDWRSALIGDCVDLFTGFPFKSADYTDSDTSVRLLRGDNIGQGKLRWDGVKRWPSEKCSGLAEYELKEGDIVLAMDRPWIPAGLKFSNVRKADLPALLVQRVARLRPKENVNADFLYCIIASKGFSEYIQNVTTGTAVPHISAKQIKEFEFRLPDLQTQEKIGGMLADLNDRIALLRETNATLEAIAKALFKSWFVDFDPVRSKAEGRQPEGLDPDTAALFPDRFEESELGLVPRGWRVRSVAEVSSSVFSGGTPDTRKAEYWVGPLRWFSSGETRHRVIVDCEKRINALAVENSSTRLAIPGDILIASAGQGHTRGQTSYCAVETYINQSVVAIRAEPSACHSLWLFHNLSRRYDEMRNISDSHSSRGSLTTKLLGGMRLVVPESLAIKSFADAVSPLMESQINNCRTLATLTSLRDTLLPRLISGQLRLPEAEALLKDAA